MSNLSMTERCSVRNVVFSEWRPHLAADERDLVTYILELTVAWGREALEMTYEQMRAGVPAPEGAGYTWRVPPIEIPRTSFYRILEQLKKRGVLLVEVIQRRFTRIRVNLNWRPEEGKMTPHLAISKSRQRAIDLSSREEDAGEPEFERAMSQVGTTKMFVNEYQSGTTVVPNPDTSKRDVPKKDVHPSTPQSGAGGVPIPKRMRERFLPDDAPGQNHPAPQLPVARRPSGGSALGAATQARCLQVETPAETVERVMAQTRANLAGRADKAKTSDTVEAYAATFTNAWAETFRGVSPRVPSPKELYMLRSTLRSRFKDNPSVRHAFIDYMVRNWAEIIAAQFGWMTYRQPPNRPDISFLCAEKFIGRFLDAFAMGERENYIKLLPAEERELERMLDAGSTREQAMVAIGERRALSKMRAEDQEVRRLNAQALKEAGEARKQREQAMRDELRRRAEEKRKQAEPRTHEPFEELENLPPIELIELPPFDPSAFD